VGGQKRADKAFKRRATPCSHSQVLMVRRYCQLRDGVVLLVSGRQTGTCRVSVSCQSLPWIGTLCLPLVSCISCLARPKHATQNTSQLTTKLFIGTAPLLEWCVGRSPSGGQRCAQPQSMIRGPAACPRSRPPNTVTGQNGRAGGGKVGTCVNGSGCAAPCCPRLYVILSPPHTCGHSQSLGMLLPTSFLCTYLGAAPGWQRLANHPRKGSIHQP